MGCLLRVLGTSWGCLGSSCGGFFPPGDRLGGDVAYDVVFGMVSDGVGDAFSWIFNVKMSSSWGKMLMTMKAK